MKTLLIDNYDSYTYNLYQLLAEISGVEPLVLRNDACRWQDIDLTAIDNIVLSPGPGRPERGGDFGLCADAIAANALPLLGVCLGHQGLAHHYGSRIKRAPEPIHGQIHPIYHRGQGLFEGIQNPMPVVRYHSLIAQNLNLDVLEVLARTEDGLIMALKHRSRAQWGVQFHPESVGTPDGRRLLQNFYALSAQWAQQRKKSTRGMQSTSKIGPESPSAARSPLHWHKMPLTISAQSLFETLFADEKHAFWLDSSQSIRENGRFSYMGANPSEIFELQGASSELEGYFDRVNAHLAQNHRPTQALPFDFHGGLVGFLAYPGGDPPLDGEKDIPAAHFMAIQQFIAIDHHENRLYLVALCPEEAESKNWIRKIERHIDDLAEKEAKLGPIQSLTVAKQTQSAENKTEIEAKGAKKPIEFRLFRNREHYEKDIAAAMAEIFAGESYEICLTNALLCTTQIDPLDFYRVLRRKNPAPFAAFYQTPGFHLASSSPEEFLRLNDAGKIQSKPIKGTRKRGVTPEADAALAEDLATHIKDRAENLMIVDLLRNDLGRICQIGSVNVPKLMQVETYESVHQLVSTVQGYLKPGLGIIDALRAAFPGGSMTGAPKIRTMEIIDRLEARRRGPYAGTLGYLSYSGSALLNIIIRTAVITESGLSIGVGGAIVALSEIEAEYEEMLLKGKRLMQAVAESQTGDAQNYHLDPD